MGTLIDETGNRYGRLTVLEEAGRSCWRRALWLCRCDCGNEVVVSGTKLRSGAVKSCGCLRSHTVDELGNRYGRLVVIEEAGRNRFRNTMWLCQCDCGNTVVVKGVSLRKGEAKSCGCLGGGRVNSRVKQEVGNRYGRLLVVEHAGSNGWGAAQWLCRCDCGKEIIVAGTLLRQGKVKSCGCLRLGKKRKPHKDGGKRGSYRLSKEASLNHLYSSYKRGARDRGLVFELTKREFRHLTQEPCFYCGVEPKQKVWNGGSADDTYIYNGLDRKDNDKGYTIDNVVPCCKRCNRAKNVMPAEEFVEMAERIYRHSVRDDACCPACGWHCSIEDVT
jgi:hypothetical protein